MMKHFFLLFLLVACSHTEKKAEAPKRNIVLIQGMHLDETSWKDVKEQLTLQRFSVTTIDRTGRDGDAEVSLKNLATVACEKTPEKSILVAHSLGGAIAGEMVGICPQKITQIIYVSALVPLKGEKPFDQMSKADQKEYGKAVSLKSGKFTPKTAKYFFSITDVTFKFDLVTAPKLYAESTSLNAQPITFDPAAFKAIPKAYIYTSRDKTISLKTQEGFVSKSKITKTATLATGHFPMLSNPELLSQEIIKLSL